MFLDYKFVKVVLIAGLLLVVLLLGVEFSTLHADPVTVNYLLGKTTLPLSLVVVCVCRRGRCYRADRCLCRAAAALAGRTALRQTLASKEQEVNLLAQKPGGIAVDAPGTRRSS